MLARGALCRLAAEAPKQATHDLPKLASLVQTARVGYALPIRTLFHATQLQVRSYATGEPTDTIKKAVKAKAAAGKSVKKTTSTKKAAPKKAKKKAVPNKPAKKPKKVLTDEEKEKKLIARLRELALKEPVSRNSLSAYNVYFQETVKGLDKTGQTPDLTEVSKGWKNITPAEHEKFNHLAAERNEARAAEYKAWVESHTPDQIRIANNARHKLRRKLAGKLKHNANPAHTQTIVDDRRVKRAQTAWGFFFAERQTSPDYKGIAVPERAKLTSGEWKALSASEKQRYQDQAAADKQRYEREVAALSKA